jgi:hypothetical protein
LWMAQTSAPHSRAGTWRSLENHNFLLIRNRYSDTKYLLVGQE